MYVSSLWAVINILFFVLALSKSIAYTTQVTVMLVTNLIIVFVSLGIILYLYCKFSGIPYQSEEKKVLLKKMALVYGVWTFALFIRNIPALFIASGSDGKYAKNDFANAIITGIMVIVLQVVPYLLALESKFIEMFNVSFADRTQEIDEN